MPNAVELMTLAAYARRREVSRAAVTAAVKSGRITTVLDPKGRQRIDVRAADRDWRANSAPAPGKRVTFASARARRETAAAELAEMKAAQARGELVRVDDIITTWSARFAGMKMRLLALPAKLAPRVAAPDRVAEAQELARETVDELLTEFASYGLPEPAPPILHDAHVRAWQAEKRRQGRSRKAAGA